MNPEITGKHEYLTKGREELKEVLFELGRRVINLRSNNSEESQTGTLRLYDDWNTQFAELNKFFENPADISNISELRAKMIAFQSVTRDLIFFMEMENKNNPQNGGKNYKM